VDGQKRIRTPNIDRLATESIRFTNYYSGSPRLCAVASFAPHRAAHRACSTITGLSSRRAGGRERRTLRPPPRHPPPISTRSAFRPKKLRNPPATW